MEDFFRVYIISPKGDRDLENSGQLCKPKTHTFRVLALLLLKISVKTMFTYSHINTLIDQ